MVVLSSLKLKLLMSNPLDKVKLDYVTFICRRNATAKAQHLNIGWICYISITESNSGNLIMVTLLSCVPSIELEEIIKLYFLTPCVN